MFCTPVPFIPALCAAPLSILESSVPVAAPIASTMPVPAATAHPIGPREAIPCLIADLVLFCVDVMFSPYLETADFCPHFETKSPPSAANPPAEPPKPALKLNFPEEVAALRNLLPTSFNCPNNLFPSD